MFSYNTKYKYTFFGFRHFGRNDKLFCVCHPGFVVRQIPGSIIFHSNADMEIPAFHFVPAGMTDNSNVVPILVF